LQINFRCSKKKVRQSQPAPRGGLSCSLSTQKGERKKAEVFIKEQPATSRFLIIKTGLVLCAGKDHLRAPASAEFKKKKN
jgi:hypothetical protein